MESWTQFTTSACKKSVPYNLVLENINWWVGSWKGEETIEFTGNECQKKTGTCFLNVPKHVIKKLLGFMLWAVIYYCCIQSFSYKSKLDIYIL